MERYTENMDYDSAVKALSDKRFTKCGSTHDFHFEIVEVVQLSCIPGGLYNLTFFGNLVVTEKGGQ